MKTYNKKAAILLFSLIAGSFLLAAPAKAEEKNNFCAKLGPGSQQMLGRMQGKKHSRIEPRKIKEDKISSIRSQADLKRSETYKKLYEKYPSEVQKLAIDDYKNTIEDALRVRREKTDVARQDYIERANSVIKSHYEIINSEETKLISAVQAASQLAADSCLEGKDPKIIAQTFKQSMTSLKGEFKVNKSSLENNKTEIDQLLIKRKQAIDSAMAEFKLSLETAKNKLISSLK